MDTHNWKPGDDLPEFTEAHVLSETRLGRTYAINDAYVARVLTMPIERYERLGLITHIVNSGFPAPRIYDTVGNTLIMERVHGPTLFQALVSGETSIDDGAYLNVALMEQLHTMPVPDELRQAALDDPIVGALTNPQHLAILHMDLHPANIILTEHDAVPISWECIRVGPPELDQASTALAVGILASEEHELQHGAQVYLHRLHQGFGTGYLDYLDAASTFRAMRPDVPNEERDLLATAQSVIREVANRS